MDRPVLRRAGWEDAAALALVGAATFLESYAHFIGLADMLAHIDAKCSEASFRTFASDPACTLWLAEQATTRAPLGYAVLTSPDLPIEGRDGDIELRRIYLLASWHGAGLGRRLYEIAADHARAQGMARLLIGVYSENDRAIGFYRRMGAQQIGTRRFQVGDAFFDDLIMGMDL